MIIYIHEEQVYRSWVTHHRMGYVLDGRHQPKLGSFTLHRAVCADVKHGDGKHSHWTTGGRLKACSLNRQELEKWVQAELQLPLTFCPQCQPQLDADDTEAGSGHLTRLSRDVLDYVFESALIHLEWPEGPPYRVTVADIANCMGKTCGQITPSLKTLVDNGLVSLPGISHIETKVPPGRLVLPTPRAMQSLPAFAQEKSETLQAQLDTLLVENC